MWKLTLQDINTTPKELKTERDCSHRQLFRPLWGSSVWRNNQRKLWWKISAHSDLTLTYNSQHPQNHAMPRVFWYFISTQRRGNWSVKTRWDKSSITGSTSRCTTGSCSLRVIMGLDLEPSSLPFFLLSLSICPLHFLFSCLLSRL